MAKVGHHKKWMVITLHISTLRQDFVLGWLENVIYVFISTKVFTITGPFKYCVIKGGGTGGNP